MNWVWLVPAIVLGSALLVRLVRPRRVPPGVWRCSGCGARWYGAGATEVEGRLCLECLRAKAHKRMELGG